MVMSVFLENDYLKVSVIEKGAELKSVVSKTTKLEYMWSGDPAFWGKTSPVLFPVVGTLKKRHLSVRWKIVFTHEARICTRCALYDRSTGKGCGGFFSVEYVGI